MGGNKTLESLLSGNLRHNMTSYESMAATLQAVAALQGCGAMPGIGNIYPGIISSL